MRTQSSVASRGSGALAGQRSPGPSAHRSQWSHDHVSPVALECRVKPVRLGHAELLGQFDGFFASRRLVVMDVSAEVIPYEHGMESRCEGQVSTISEALRRRRHRQCGGYEHGELGEVPR